MSPIYFIGLYRTHLLKIIFFQLISNIESTYFLPGTVSFCSLVLVYVTNGKEANWFAMDPFQKYTWCIQKLRYGGKLIQRDIFVDKSQSTKIGYHLVVLNFLLFYVGSIYTFQYYDLVTSLAAIPIVAGCSQVCQLIFMYMNKQFNKTFDIIIWPQVFMEYLVMMDLRPLADVFNYFGNIYKKNSKKCARDFDLCQRFSKISKFIVIGMPSVYFTVVTLFHLAKFSTGIMAGHVKPTVFYFPILDHCGLFGVILTHILNVFDTYFTITLASPFEMLLYVLTANIMLNSMVIVRDLDDLKMSLLRPETSQRENERKLIEVIQSIRTFIELSLI